MEQSFDGKFQQIEQDIIEGLGGTQVIILYLQRGNHADFLQVEELCLDG